MNANVIIVANNARLKIHWELHKPLSLPIAFCLVTTL